MTTDSNNCPRCDGTVNQRTLGNAGDHSAMECEDCGWTDIYDADDAPSVVATACALILKYHAGRRYLGAGKYAVNDDAKRAAEALGALQRVWPQFVAIAEDEYDQTVSAEGGTV